MSLNIVSGFYDLVDLGILTALRGRAGRLDGTGAVG
jgi:hypothetical protein